MTLAITGASGHLGALVIGHLLDRGTPAKDIVALVRRPASVVALSDQGVSVRPFDYDQPERLAASLDGVDSLLLISGSAFGKREAQHRAVIDAAIAAGVKRLVYTSAPQADSGVNPVLPEHWATEKYLASSGLPHVVLRNGWYNENYLADLANAAQTGAVVSAAGDGRVASAARNDLAEAAAVVLASQEVGRTYTLTGDLAWSFADLASDFSAVLGKPVSLVSATRERKREILTAAGLDAGLIDFALGVDVAIAAGELGGVNGELSGLIGRPTTPLIETLRSA